MTGQIRHSETRTLQRLFIAWVLLGIILVACDGAKHPPGRPDANADPDPNAVAYPWNLPPGFPVPRVPDDNPMSVAKARLGRYLFYDTRLSGNQTYACASCHAQGSAFTDGRPQSIGATGAVLRHNAMSLTNVVYDAATTWANPLLRTLEDQALVPLFNEDPVELGWTARTDEILTRLRADVRYPMLFRAAFPEAGAADPVTLGNVVKALACFERTMISANSAYDRAQRGDPTALSDAARRGQKLFFGERLECYHCHGGFDLSDTVVHANTRFDELIYHNTGLYNVDGRGAYPAGDQGLVEITQQPTDMGKFRAPTLRNIELTAPYMHDGSIATLEDVLAHYGAGGRRIASGPNAGDGSANPHKDGLVAGFELTLQERDDVLAFLRSLTDWDFVHDTRLSDPFAVNPDASAGGSDASHP